MKRTKSILALLLAAALVLSLAACGEKNTETQAESKNETQPAESKGESKSETQKETEPAGTDMDKVKVEILDKYDGKADGYTFRVGVGKAVITPKVGEPLCGYTPFRNSESVHDDLNIICHAFEQDGRLMLSLVMDTCNCGSADTAIATMLNLKLGVPKENIHVAATHTHSGPYTTEQDFNSTILIPAAVQAATDAISGLQWAEMGVATIQSQVGCNRRELNPKTGLIKLGQDPNGPYDPTMTVISFRNHKGEIISNIIHYGCHNTASGKNVEITRDWCGVMKDAMEELTGGITAFYNGAQGDVGPRLASGKTTGTLKEALAHGEIAAADATACWKTITEWKKDCKLCIQQGTISVPYVKLDEKAIREELDDLLDKASLNNDEDARKTGLTAALNLVNTKFDSLVIKRTFFSLGDVCFAPSPFETFTNMILDIRERSPYPYTLVISNSNGHQGYFPTADELPRGGYEIQQYDKRPSVRKTPWLIENGTEYYANDALALINALAEQR